MNINWDLIDTVLLDMDGTLLDLRFDNYFGHEIVPTKFANKHGIGIEEANLYLKPLFKKMEGSLMNHL
jgi:putative hydrolase of the HAD superfamily